MRIETIHGIHTSVGECPLWDVESGCLYLVDILGRLVLRYDPATGTSVQWAAPTTVGAVGLTDGPLLAIALADGFYTLDPASGRFSLQAPAGCHPDAHITEGKVDPAGRFVATSAHIGFRDPVGAIHQWSPGLGTCILAGDIVLGNGVCWSRDGRTLYVADSVRGVIYAHPYDPAAGTAGTRRVFFEAAGSEGFPDGATVDADDHVWTVMHGSPFILRLTPAGVVERRIRLPTDTITSLAFGGPLLDDLYVTSLDPAAVNGRTSEATPVDPDQDHGSLFRVRGLSVTGVREPRVSLGKGVTQLHV